jgi:hypothetical protein
MANSEAIEPSGSVQALRTLVNREHLATRVYRRQIGAFKNLLEVDNWLRAASANEQEHIDHISAHYTECLAKYEWDEMSRGLLMHLRSEEEGHIERWERALSMLPGS